NDLTQMGFGFSRDDIGGFVPAYVEKRILPADPFNILDQEGIGELIDIGIRRGRATRPKLKVGICGEHGGEPSSVEFCHRVGMDYVSCSPFRVPIARLAAAQAAIREAANAKPVKDDAAKAKGARRGRPKGSKNKPKAAGRPGRPKGSKSRPKAVGRAVKKIVSKMAKKARIKAGKKRR
ncbi:MAG TPA: pyruvate, phosphate dikinase, partial [candidate division Zixibacteria bacterium]|nr:pyruvate, phosphate dikinase [candidate division Zixibacteria bacterium]